MGRPRFGSVVRHVPSRVVKVCALTNPIDRYHSVRIDAVHYCELEEILGQTRRRRSHRGRGAEPPDVPAIRLNLLANTLKRNYNLAQQVRWFKVPYMTRETCKADLARCISACPNLLYVDLPDGCFTGENACLALTQELQQNCRHLRKMKYAGGSESHLETLLLGRWPEITYLQLSGLRIEPTLLRRVLGSLAYLQELECSELGWLGNEIFHQSPQLPPFPALKKLTLKETPRITADGIVSYLEDHTVRAHLASLSLSETGIPITDLHRVLWAASSLTDLTITESVTHSLPIDPIPPLASISLQTLNFEVTDSIDAPRSALHAPSASYYAYLTTSLQTNSLPGLRILYVRDATFPEQLTLAPPVRPFAPDSGSRNPFAGGFSQSLEVYTKGIDEQEWVFNSVMPSEVPGRRGSMSGGRPLSSYSAHKGLGPQWGGDARKSIVVGNGFGGFLAVPAPEENQRPRTASGGSTTAEKPRGSWYRASGAHERRGSRADLWR